LGTYAVVLGAEPQTLLELERKLQKEALPFVSIRENDEPYAGELLALGVKPDRKSKLKKHFSSLPLLT
jgi:hypothetical protein